VTDVQNMYTCRNKTGKTPEETTTKAGIIANTHTHTNNNNHNKNKNEHTRKQ